MELDKIQQIVAGVLNVDPSEVTPGSTLRFDLGADSLDSYQIFTRIEENFHIRLTQKQMEECETIGDVIQAIRQAMK